MNTEIHMTTITPPPAAPLDWRETKPGRWLGQAAHGGNYIVEGDNGFYSVARITPTHVRDLGGCCDPGGLASAKKLAQDHFNDSV